MRRREVLASDPHPLRWWVGREGYQRLKPRSAWIGQVVWAIIGCCGMGLLANPSHAVLGIVVPLVAAASVIWIEWSSRNENQSQVNQVFGIIMVIIVLVFAASRRNRP